MAKRETYWPKIKENGGYLVNRKFVDATGEVVDYQARITATYVSQDRSKPAYWPHLRTEHKLAALKKQTRTDKEGNVSLLYPEMVATLTAQHNREIAEYKKVSG